MRAGNSLFISEGDFCILTMSGHTCSKPLLASTMPAMSSIATATAVQAVDGFMARPGWMGFGDGTLVGRALANVEGFCQTKKLKHAQAAGQQPGTSFTAITPGIPLGERITCICY